MLSTGEPGLAPRRLLATVDDVEAFHLRLPLPEPLIVLGELIHDREWVFVRARAGDVVGTGFGLTRGLPLADVIRRQLRPLTVGRPAGEIGAVYEAARDRARMTGLAGAYGRGLAALDMALWDLYGRLLGEPLWRLLGGRSASVEVIAIAGYYRREDSVGRARRDVEALLGAGYRRFKIPVGADLDLDVRRLEAIRASIGDDAMLGVDAGGSLDSIVEARRLLNKLRRFDIAFLEDPFPADAWQLAIDLARETEVPIAFGEAVNVPGLIQRLGSGDGVDIVRPDATVLGVTGFGRAVAPALEQGIPVYPHYFPDIHAPLVAGLGGRWVEESAAEADSVGFRTLRARQPRIEAGRWLMGEEPGFGIEWNEELLSALRQRSPGPED